MLTCAGLWFLWACCIAWKPTHLARTFFLAVSRQSGRRKSALRSCCASPKWQVEPESLGLSSTKLEEFAAELDQAYIQSGLLKGAVLAVVRHGQVVAVWEFGDYTQNTVFKLYSISKVFTAMAGLQLLEEHAVSLDEPISNLVPEWPEHLKVHSNGEPVSSKHTLTLRHCLTHTGGFSNALPTVHPCSAMRPLELARLKARITENSFPPKNLRQMVEREGQQPHIFEPGCHFNYCGAGSQLVARAVENLTGLSIAEYMQKKLFRPAQMNNTGFTINESLAGCCVSTDRKSVV